MEIEQNQDINISEIEMVHSEILNGRNIGLIGGCINNQPGMPKKDLYHKVLNDFLENDPETISYKISLGSYLSYDKVVQKTKSFITDNKLSHIYIFIRNFPLMPLVKPIIRFEKEAGNISWGLHPNIWKRQMNWNPEITNFQGINEFVFKKRKRFEMRDVNILAGTVLGLRSWALKYIGEQFESIYDFCTQQNVRLTIIAPQKSPTSIMGNNMCRWTTDFLKSFCKERGIKYIDIYKFNLEYFENDEIHLNAEAHKVLGREIYEDLMANIKFAR